MNNFACSALVLAAPLLVACGGSGAVARPNGPLGTVANVTEAEDFMRGAGLYALETMGVGNLNGQSARRPGAQSLQASSGSCARTEGNAVDADQDGLAADQMIIYDCDLNSNGSQLKYSGNLHLVDASDTVAYGGALIELNDISFLNTYATASSSLQNGTYSARGLSTITATGLTFVNKTDIEVQANGSLRSLFFSSNTVAVSADTLVGGYYGDSQITLSATPSGLSSLNGNIAGLLAWARFRRGVTDRVMQITTSSATFNATTCSASVTSNAGYWENATFTFIDAGANQISVQYSSCTPVYTYTPAGGLAQTFAVTP